MATYRGTCSPTIQIQVELELGEPLAAASRIQPIFSATAASVASGGAERHDIGFARGQSQHPLPLAATRSAGGAAGSPRADLRVADGIVQAGAACGLAGQQRLHHAAPQPGQPRRATALERDPEHRLSTSARRGARAEAKLEATARTAGRASRLPWRAGRGFVVGDHVGATRSVDVAVAAAARERPPANARSVQASPVAYPRLDAASFAHPLLRGTRHSGDDTKAERMRNQHAVTGRDSTPAYPQWAAAATAGIRQRRARWPRRRQFMVARPRNFFDQAHEPERLLVAFVARDIARRDGMPARWAFVGQVASGKASTISAITADRLARARLFDGHGGHVGEQSGRAYQHGERGIIGFVRARGRRSRGRRKGGAQESFAEHSRRSRRSRAGGGRRCRVAVGWRSRPWPAMP